MTITLGPGKRCLPEPSSTLSAAEPGAAGPSAPAAKRLRVLAPLSEQLVSTCSVQPSAASPAQQHQGAGAAARKRSRQEAVASAGADGTPASPAAASTGKRGKRGDGRSSTAAAASPSRAAAALQALLTCEGLEKDANLETELAYVTARQQQRAAAAAAASASAAAAAAAGAGSASPGSADQDGDADTRVRSRQDAARSSRDKRRDQDQAPHRSGRVSTTPSRRSDQALAAAASGGGQHRRSSGSTSEHQAATTGLPATAAAAADTDADAAAEPSPRPRASDLVPDREWARLFAVLSISGQRGSQEPEAAHEQQQQQQRPPAPMQDEAPSTPARVIEPSASPCAVTPTRLSFLASEFSRVQQRQRSVTPERLQRRQAAAAADGPRLALFPGGCFGDADMAL